ncbi:hypothetical protein PoB_003336600 [Plakobranchus ocellatus]|uniref:Uncharacterized protein n=1 Tax=Plakobranchus ocellatus TaxID=259542 RepID=A0AAV4AEY9_9GAST|nr:hypothetical protein PoB_003336600 [Plakobranchus ocellatus]
MSVRDKVPDDDDDSESSRNRCAHFLSSRETRCMAFPVRLPVESLSTTFYDTHRARPVGERRVELWVGHFRFVWSRNAAFEKRLPGHSRCYRMMPSSPDPHQDQYLEPPTPCVFAQFGVPQN